MLSPSTTTTANVFLLIWHLIIIASENSAFGLTTSPVVQRSIRNTRLVSLFPTTAKRRRLLITAGAAVSSEDTKEQEDDDDDLSSWAMQEFLRPADDCKVNRMSGTDLAYIGDVVFELYVRSKLVWPSRRTSDLQNLAVSIVRAENQSTILAQIKDNFHLTDQEMQIVSRGRNSVTKSKNRRNPAAYQDSTAFEALIGYLYITDQSRCRELFKFLESVILLEK